jgi:hypothetical protein
VRFLLLLIGALIFSVSAAVSETNVLCIQKFLSKTAFDAGSVDGRWGKKTGTAINNLFDQAGITEPKTIKKKDAAEVCKILQGSKKKVLLESVNFKIYPILIGKKP